MPHPAMINLSTQGLYGIPVFPPPDFSLSQMPFRFVKSRPLQAGANIPVSKKTFRDTEHPTQVLD
jgi:hypothetical protein